MFASASDPVLELAKATRTMLTLNPPTPSPNTFHLFSSLAPELRIKIWSYCCFPRTVTLKYHRRTNSFVSHTSPPILLSISQESRHEALKIYNLSFSTSTSPSQIYFSPYQDTLYLPRCREMGYDETLRDFRELVNISEENTLNKIQSLAIDHVDIDIKRPWESYNKASFIRSFPGLSEVMLVVSSDRTQPPGRFNSWISNADADQGKAAVGFKTPSIDVEILLRVWACFRRGFVLEERAFEGVCESVGREYTKFTLPIVRMMEKA